MIIFYNLKTGEINGEVGGRIHKAHSNVWMGNKKETGRLMVEWKPVKWFDKDGHEIPLDCLDAGDEDGNLLIFTADFEPDTKQKELFMDLDKGLKRIYDYKVDLKTKLLIPKE